MNKIILLLFFTFFFTLFAEENSSSDLSSSSFSSSSFEEEEPIVTEGLCGSKQEDCYWEFDENTKTLKITGNGTMTNFRFITDVPWSHFVDQIESIEMSENITSIGSYAFANIHKIKSFEISEKIEEIWTNPFLNCLSLKTFKISENNTKYSEYEGMLIENNKNIISYLNTKKDTFITLPDNIVEISKYAIAYNTHLETLIMKNSLVIIRNSGIYACSYLKTVYYYTKNPTLEYSIFDRCDSLEKVYVPHDFSSTFNGEISPNKIVKAVAACGKNAYCSIDTDTGLFVVYGVGEMYNYTSGNQWSSYRNVIKNIEFVQGITTIGAYSFYYGNGNEYGYNLIQSVTMPNTINKIYKYAFSYCNNLKTVYWSSNLILIDEHAFEYTSLNEIQLPSSVETINNFVFSHSSSTENIVLPSQLKTLGEGVFFGLTKLKSFSISSQNKNFVFNNGVLFDLNITRLITYPSQRNGNQFSIPQTVNSIDSTAFGYASQLTQVTIPESVKKINGNPFAGCASLSTIKIEGESIYSFKNGLLIKNNEELVTYLQTNQQEEFITPENITKISDFSIIKITI